MASRTNTVTLRKHIIEARKRLPKRIQDKNAHQLCLRIIRHPDFRRASNIGVYLAHRGEIDLSPIIKHAWKLRKKIAIPVILPNFRMRFVRFSSNTRLARNHFGIAEPANKRFVCLDELDLLLCPLVGFNQHGFRIGMGGGYYDRALSKVNRIKTKLWGVAHDFQKCQTIHPESWDIPMHKIATEKRIYTARYI